MFRDQGRELRNARMTPSHVLSQKTSRSGGSCHAFALRDFDRQLKTTTICSQHSTEMRWHFGGFSLVLEKAGHQLHSTPIWHGVLERRDGQPNARVAFPMQQRNTFHFQSVHLQVTEMDFTLVKVYVRFIGLIYRHVRSFTCFRRVYMFPDPL